MNLKIQSHLALAALFVTLTIASIPAGAHQTSGRHNKTQNGLGCSLHHFHLPRCLSSGECANGARCPSSDAVCETAFGFRPSDRQYSWTNQWNCHGRTFDNRGSWTGDASPFISCDFGYSPATPRDGDAILWSGGSEHSATIIGSWRGLSTTISSKYGCCGGYRHALADAVNVYGSDWSVVRFTSGSPTFKSLGVGDREVPDDPEQLNEIRAQMPWYDSVVASSVVHAMERARLVSQAGRLSEETRRKLKSTEDPLALIALLAQDLRMEHHFAPLAGFNHPRQSVDFVAGIEAGQILVTVATEFPDVMLEPVLASLRDDALSLETSAGVKSASLYFLAKLLSSEERNSFSAEVRLRASQSVDGQIDMVDYYRARYLD